MKKALCILLCLVLLAGLLLAGNRLGYIGKQEISVAIYPYVPDQELFKEVLTRHWAEIEPNVELDFKGWDGYTGVDPEGIDVIMYDATATSYLVDNGFVQPIAPEEIADIDSFVPCALNGATRNGQYYGIPFLMCSEFLMYHKDDAELNEVDSIEQLCDVLAEEAALDYNRGLSTNYSYNYIWYYLDAIIDHRGEFLDYEEAPDCDAIDPEIVELFADIRSVLVPEEDLESELGTFLRPTLFNEGSGRAHFGYSEDLSFMEDIRNDLVIKPVSFFEGENIQLFFADIISVSSEVKAPKKLEWCKKLMNLVASEAFLQEVCFGSENPQYMLPARQNLYAIAAQQDPIYERLSELVMKEDNQILRFGPELYAYQSEAYDKLN